MAREDDEATVVSVVVPVLFLLPDLLVFPQADVIAAVSASTYAKRPA